MPETSNIPQKPVPIRAEMAVVAMNKIVERQGQLRRCLDSMDEDSSPGILIASTIFPQSHYILALSRENHQMLLTTMRNMAREELASLEVQLVEIVRLGAKLAPDEMSADDIPF